MKKAFIFAAGLGTRLRPLTDHCPKALIEVAGKTLLEWNLNKLKSFGFTEVIINVHHHAEMIHQFLDSHNNFGIKIHISDETGELLETGGALKKATHLLTETPFLIHNVDILSDIDINQLWQTHISSTALSTLAVTSRTSSRSLLFDHTMTMRGWQNNMNGELRPKSLAKEHGLTTYAFAGIHILSPDALPLLSKYPTRFSIIDFYIDYCTSKQIACYISPNATVIDVGRIDSIPQATHFLDNK